VLFAALGSLVACSGETTDSAPLTGVVAAPDPVVVDPELSAIAFFPGWLAAGVFNGTLPFAVDLADPERPWRQHERLEVILETSRGDREVLVRGSANVCRLRALQNYDCTAFVISMDAGHAVDELSSLIEATGASIEFRFITGAGAVRLREGDLDAAMAKARTWPNVRSVEYSIAAQTGLVPGELVFTDTLLRLVRGDVVPLDGALQIAPGDEVRVRYRQPSGIDLVASETSN
jgi:hypothetical protein